MPTYSGPDSDEMNCESFVRGCYDGVYRSSQAENFTGSAHMRDRSDILSRMVIGSENSVGASVKNVDRFMYVTVIVVVVACAYTCFF